jgi:hypothetical protein
MLLTVYPLVDERHIRVPGFTSLCYQVTYQPTSSLLFYTLLCSNLLCSAPLCSHPALLPLQPTSLCCHPDLLPGLPTFTTPRFAATPLCCHPALARFTTPSFKAVLESFQRPPYQGKALKNEIFPKGTTKLKSKLSERYVVVPLGVFFLKWAILGS